MSSHFLVQTEIIWTRQKYIGTVPNLFWIYRRTGHKITNKVNSGTI